MKHEDYQQPDFYRFSEDSLHLVRFVLKNYLLKEDVKVLDAGAGSGVIGLEFFRQSSYPFHLSACEAELEFESILRQNYKNFGPANSHLHFMKIEELVETQKQYDLILSNPPYFHLGHGLLSPEPKKNNCRFFLQSSAESFFESLKKLLAPKGKAYFLIRLDQGPSQVLMEKIKAQLELSLTSCAIMSLTHEN